MTGGRSRWTLPERAGVRSFDQMMFVGRSLAILLARAFLPLGALVAAGGVAGTTDIAI